MLSKPSMMPLAPRFTALFLFVIACSTSEPARTDADLGSPSENDSGIVQDLGTEDSGSLEAVDAGASDLGVLDQGALDQGAQDAGAPQGTFACTLVIGYSQVGQPQGGWFVTGGVFESIVENARWELLWNSGAGVDRWQAPNYAGWSRPLISPCSNADPDAPDRIILSISGPYGEDVDAWVQAIEGTVVQIRTRYPSVRRIVLQPVVGGPQHQTCTRNGTDVRASWQHAHIDQAIARVAGADIQAGASPEVQVCSDYRDELGHLTVSAAEAVARWLAAYYAP